MSQKSAAAALVSLAYYPSLLIAATSAVFVPGLLLNVVPSSIAWTVAAVAGVFCLPLFAMVLFDRSTRRAIDNLNASLKRNWPSWSWRQRMFAPEYGDRTALLLNRLILAELALSGFVDQAVFEIAFVAFALTTLLLMLLLAYPRAPTEA